VLSGSQAPEGAGQGSDDLALGRVVVRRRPSGQSVEGRPVVDRQQGDRAVHGQERRRGSLEHVAAREVGDLLEAGDVGGVRGERPAEQQRAGVDQRPAAEAVLGTQLRVVPRSDGVEVAERELVEGGVPGEVAEAVDRGAVARDPAVHPGQPGGVVAGLVVRVCAGVSGVPGAGLDGQ